MKNGRKKEKKEEKMNMKSGDGKLSLRKCGKKQKEGKTGEGNGVKELESKR